MNVICRINNYKRQDFIFIKEENKTYLEMNPQEKSNETDQMKKFVQSYGKADDKKAWTALGISFLIEIVVIILIHLNQKLLGWGLHTLNNVRFFIQFHDMAHFSYFSSITLNRIFGKIIGVYTHFPFNAWRDGHNHHHKHFGNLDRLDMSQTILFTKKQYDQMKGAKKMVVRIFREPIIFFFITLPFVWFIGIFHLVIKRYGLISWTFLQKVLSFLSYSVLLPMLGVPAFQMWLTIYLSNIMGSTLFHLQHSVNIPYRQRKQKWNSTKAAIEGSTYLQIPQFLRPYTNGIEYHHIHHLNTNVPSYAIQNCHQQFDEKNKQGNYWDKFNINRVKFDLALKSMLNVMLNQETGQLIPFSYVF